MVCVMAPSMAACDMLARWREGVEPWVQFVAVDEQGVPQMADEVPAYSPAALQMHAMPVDPTRLKQHILKPRAWESGGIPDVLFEEVIAKLDPYLEVHFADRPMFAAHPCAPHAGNDFFVGCPPRPSQAVRYHGTHFCSALSVITEGAKTVVCKRKGEQRMCFGKTLYTTASMESACRWSQYVDVGYALGYNCPIGWFVNAVAVLPDTKPMAGLFLLLICSCIAW